MLIKKTQQNLPWINKDKQSNKTEAFLGCKEAEQNRWVLLEQGMAWNGPKWLWMSKARSLM